MTEDPKKLPDGDDWLDEEHQQIADDVERHDTPEAKQDPARGWTARLTGAIHQLTAEQKDLGTKEHLDAIRKTGWCPWAAFFRFGSWAIAAVDAAIWWVFWSRVLVKTLFWVPLALAVAAAMLAKGAGQYVATTRLTDPTSARATVLRQVTAAGTAMLLAIIVGIATLSTFVLPASWAEWLVKLGSVFLFLLNILLGFAAGVGGTLGTFLGKPQRYDENEYLIRQKLLARERLANYLVMLVAAMALGSFALPARAAGESNYVIGVDETASLDPSRRQDAAEFLVTTALPRSHAIGATSVVALTFSNQRRLVDRVWIPVPSPPVTPDCRDSQPAPLEGKAVIYSFSRNVNEGRRAAAIADCQLATAEALSRYQERAAVFHSELRSALDVTPRKDVQTHLVELLETVLADPSTRAVALVTDGFENSGVPVRRLRIRDGVPVALIIVPAAPGYASINDMLAQTSEWEKVPGIRILTIGELHAGVWDNREGR